MVTKCLKTYLRHLYRHVYTMFTDMFTTCFHHVWRCVSTILYTILDDVFAICLETSENQLVYTMLEDMCAICLERSFNHVWRHVSTRALNLWRRDRELREKHPIVTILAPYRLQGFLRAFNQHSKSWFWNINCPAGESNTLLHHQIKGLALAQCPVFSLSMQIYFISDSLSYPQRVSYYSTLFHTGLTYYFHDIGYPIIYPIVTFAYRKVKKYPIRSSSFNHVQRHVYTMFGTCLHNIWGTIQWVLSILCFKVHGYTKTTSWCHFFKMFEPIFIQNWSNWSFCWKLIR